jgi:hypothetical protein
MSEQAERFYSEWYTNEDAEQMEQPKREFIVSLDLENADIEGSIPIANTEPIVRCKDCAYMSDDGLTTAWCSENFREVRPRDFCAWGERKVVVE